MRIRAVGWPSDCTPSSRCNSVARLSSLLQRLLGPTASFVPIPHQNQLCTCPTHLTRNSLTSRWRAQDVGERQLGCARLEDVFDPSRTARLKFPRGPDFRSAEAHLTMTFRVCRGHRRPIRRTIERAQPWGPLCLPMAVAAPRVELFSVRSRRCFVWPQRPRPHPFIRNQEHNNRQRSLVF